MSHLSSRLQSARTLTAAGFRVISVGEAKSPAVASWKQYQEPETVVSDAALVAWFGDESAVRGFGILGGRASGNLTIVDFDCPEGLPQDTARRTFEAWKVRVADKALLSRLPVVATPSGGVHVYIRSDCPADGNRKLAFATTPNGFRILIETRGEGGYVVGPGSHSGCHPSGQQYVHYEGPRLPDAGTVTADELEVLLSAARTFDEKPAPEPVSAARFQGGQREEGRPGDDFNERSTWAEILQPRGFTLVRTDERGLSYWRRPGSSNKQSLTTGVRQNGRDLLYPFSPNCGVEPDIGYTRFTFLAMVDHNGDFAACSRQLRDEGYGSSDIQVPGVDLSKLAPSLSESTDEFLDDLDAVPDPGPIPAALLDVDGFLGTFVKYARSCGPKPQDELALGAGLVVLASLIGRKVVLPPSGRANVFSVNLAGSGLGKSAAIDAAKHLNAEVVKRVATANHGFAFSGMPKSDAGVIRVMAERSSVAWIIDEAGDFIEAIGSSKAPAHMRAITRILVDMFTSSNDPLYDGGAYADEKNTRSVSYPNLSILTASTPEKFVAGLSAGLREGGFVGRMLAFRGDEDPPTQRRYTFDVDALAWLSDFAVEWFEWRPTQLHELNPEAALAEVDEAAFDRLADWDEYCSRQAKERSDECWRSIWNRGNEKARKLALLHAASVVQRPDRMTIRVTEQSAVWGVAVALHSIRSLLLMIDQFGASSAAESVLKDVRRKIAEFPDGVIPKNKLTRRLQRYSNHERDAAISTLVDGEEIYRHTESTGGRPKTVFLTPKAYRRIVRDGGGTSKL